MVSMVMRLDRILTWPARNSERVNKNYASAASMEVNTP